MTSVSIVIDNYNYAQYLPRAIQSALAQTHDDVEVIVVDDGSTDDSVAVARAFEPDVRVVVKENGGQASAVNTGFIESSGDLIIYLDSDDELLPTAAERAAAAFRPGVSKIHWRLRSIDGEGRPLGFTNPSANFDLAEGDARPALIRSGRHVTPVMSGNAFSRQAMARFLPVPEPEYRIAADGYLVTVAAFAGEIVAVDEVLGNYRIHGHNFWAPDSITGDRLIQFVEHDLVKHALVRELADQTGMVAADMARHDHLHVCKRLASLRINDRKHPVKGDTRLNLLLAGILSTLRSDLSPARQLRFVLWFLATALGPDSVARSVIEALYVPQHRPAQMLGEDAWVVTDAPVADKVRRRALSVLADFELVRERSGPARVVRYLGWTGYDNMGDEALLEAHRKALLPHLVRPFPDSITLAALAAVRPRRRLVRAALLGGGTLIGRRHYRVPLERLRAAFPDVPLLMMGTGVEDPDFYGDESAQWREELRRWPEILGEFDEVLVRGPRSQELLADIGVESKIVGDTALLLDVPAVETEEGLLGVNIGGAKRLWGEDLGAIIDGMAHELNTMIASGWNVRLIPVSPRDTGPLATLATRLDAPVDMLTEFTNLDRLLRAIGQCQVFVGQKLHSVVFASALAVPALSLEYHPKCRDFQRSIGREEHTVRTDLLATGDVSDRLLALGAESDAHSRQLQAATAPLVQSLTDAATRLRDAVTERA